jgi:hypothetical protein
MKTDTLILLLAGAVGLYLITRPATPTYYPTTTTGLPTALSTLNTGNYYGNATAQDIAASGTALQGLSSLVGNLF